MYILHMFLFTHKSMIPPRKDACSHILRIENKRKLYCTCAFIKLFICNIASTLTYDSKFALPKFLAGNINLLLDMFQDIRLME